MGRMAAGVYLQIHLLCVFAVRRRRLCQLLVAQSQGLQGGRRRFSSRHPQSSTPLLAPLPFPSLDSTCIGEVTHGLYPPANVGSCLPDGLFGVSVTQRPPCPPRRCPATPASLRFLFPLHARSAHRYRRIFSFISLNTRTHAMLTPNPDK